MPGEIALLDLASGGEQRLPLAEGAWDIHPATSDSHLVLERDNGGTDRFDRTYAIVAIEAGWVGYVHVTVPVPGD